MLNYQLPAQIILEDIVVFGIIALLIFLKLARRHYQCHNFQFSPSFYLSNFVITGGASGVGKALIQKLCKHPCNIIFLDIDDSQANKALQQFNRLKHRSCIVDFIHCDLSSKQSIQNVCLELRQKADKIDFLINNAAIAGVPQRHLNQDGIQMHMATNYIGHCQLTFRLLDLLKKSKSFRIINVTSINHTLNLGAKNIKINFDDFLYASDSYDAIQAYNKSKMCIAGFTIMFAYEIYIRNLKGKIVCLHPGFVRSNIGKYQFNGFMKVLMILFFPIFYFGITKSKKQASDSILYLIVQKFGNIKNGALYNNNRAEDYHPFILNADFQKKLFEATVRIVNPKGDWSVQ